jgi:hypothetical protein
MPVVGQQPTSSPLLEAQLWSYLTAQGALIGLLGDGTNGIVRDLIVQGATLPAISMQRISTLRTPNLANGGELVSVRMQFTIIAKSAVSTETVADALRSALNLFQGPLIPNGINVLMATIADEREMNFDYDSDSHRRDVDYTIQYAQSY